MKKSVLVLLFVSLLASGYSKPENLRAYLSYSTFFSPLDGPYLETYLSVLGNSVVFVKKDNGKFQGVVMVTMLFKQQDSIKDFRKYELLSPEVEDTNAINFCFFDQQRIPLPGGTYDFELSIADKNRNKPPFTITENLDIQFPKDRVKVSGIELIESFKKATEETPITKSGYDFVPYMDNFFPASVNKITYYAEVYNSNVSFSSDEKFGVAISIESYENNKVVSSFLKIRREDAKPVNVVFGEFDISALPSGNYNLVISVRDKNNQELAENTLFFQRSNPSAKFDLAGISNIDLNSSFTSNFHNADSLRENIRCLFPIASANEKLFIKSQLKTADLATMQKFFHIFWVNRNELNPLEAWNNYYLEVLAVNKEFKSQTKKGYETDRGRVYLQFGPPNTRVEESKDPAMYPYEIWHYYKVGTQTNRRFVFYTHDVVMNDYILAHSDVNGEIYNPWWQGEVRKGLKGDITNYVRRLPEDGDDYWGSHSSDYYNNPR